MKNIKLISKIKRAVKRNKGFITFLFLMFFFRGAVADWYTIPSGSMQPTIEIGDRIIVDKTAYDLNFPFTDISLFRTNEPKRGEIIVFDSQAANIRLIKRVVGIPGDIISMKNEKLVINGKALKYSELTREYSNTALLLNEDLAGLEHLVKYDQTREPTLANFGEVTVPDDHYLVLGDNRRNSTDSRVYGFIPRKELIGKANTVALSFNYDNYYLPKDNRFWINLYDEIE